MKSTKCATLSRSANSREHGQPWAAGAGADNPACTQPGAAPHAALSTGVAAAQHRSPQAVRDQFYIICEGGNLPPPIPNFTDMKFPPAVLGVSDCGW